MHMYLRRLIVALIALSTLALVVFLAIRAFDTKPENVESEPPTTSDADATDIGQIVTESGCDDACREKIKAARAIIRPVGEDIVPYVLAEYNAYVSKTGSPWQARAKHCASTYAQEFQETEKLTLYPESLVGGIALHESAGCNPKASDRAGGKGLMQLTNISRARHVAPIAKMLHKGINDVAYKTDILENMLVGMMVFDDYERRLKEPGFAGSRAHGMLGYNEGVGGVRRDMRQMGWQSGQVMPSVGAMIAKGVLRSDRKMKPREYVPRVLACALMYDRAKRGLPIGPLASLNYRDIPGVDPRHDGGPPPAPVIQPPTPVPAPIMPAAPPPPPSIDALATECGQIAFMVGTDPHFGFHAYQCASNAEFTCWIYDQPNGQVHGCVQTR